MIGTATVENPLEKGIRSGRSFLRDILESPKCQGSVANRWPFIVCSLAGERVGLPCPSTLG